MTALNQTLSMFCSFVPKFHLCSLLFSSHSVITDPQALPHFAFISCSVGIAKPLFRKFAIKGTLWSFATLGETSFLQMGFCCFLYCEEKALRVPVLFTSCHRFDTILVIDSLWQEKKKEGHCRIPATKEVKKKTASYQTRISTVKPV